VYAPAAGTVVAARDDVPDLRIGTTDRVRPEGNHVVLDIGPRLMAPDGRRWTTGLRTFPIEPRATVRIRGGVRTTPATDLRRNDILQTASGAPHV
jgi:hypothetical protein